MNNMEDILHRVLLNMRYDSKMTLKENYNVIVSEQQKTPSVSAGEVETLGVVQDSPQTSKNGSVINAVDYNGKALTFFGIKDKTIQEKINEWSEEVKSSKESSYRETPNYVNVVEYVGPDWGRNAYKSYQQNKIKFDELKQKVGEKNLKYKKKVSGWNYKKSTIGYVASRCRSSLQNELKTYAEKNNLTQYQTKEWYTEPNGMLGCVENSIKTMFNGLNKNGLFSFWVTNPNTTQKDYYYISFSCGMTSEDTVKTFQARQFDPNAPAVEVKIPTKCDSSSVIVSGYKSSEGKIWEKTKNENKKIVDNLTKQKPTDNVVQKDEKGSVQGSKLGSAGGEEGSDGSITLDLSL